MFRYGPGSAHVAFKSASPHRVHVVAVGGLTDGLLFSKWIPLLADRLADNGACLVQTLLTSSHQGWGLGSLKRDADELLLLAQCLAADHDSQGVVLVGHSTGCQDAVEYARRHRANSTAAPLLGAVLQAPVSDRESLGMEAATPERTRLAEQMVAEGRGTDAAFIARDVDGAAVSADRWLSLATLSGADDMFSSDLSDEELREKLGGLAGLPTLLLLSGADECVPPSVDYPALGDRMAAAIGSSARAEVVEGGKHSLGDTVEEAAERIAAFVGSIR